ncbi:hypothetical protein SAMN05660909_00116 [Chitinophaga terrae (ex Kim and Jung 2007)]|uniref:HMA domain-containing protein n=1 Tax=Chitinophaga terrae (ex Kim and Jung 2007) TaxID=408074 RepID=A0A1H3WWS7_9BACT|nr:hypothetical protein [Chitinophaga terrae (ex Kim and Jung 2007)]MDQ0107029.1 hypothetical protein [Chitinophaga terrae (ex Kim and Jung 2007)]GEP90275.1 hypothetical protein CTE07_19200 [Chitinophaga terrae (ex Kim and Jung 2007)]SDZ91410.1 hypothetical protein SAMN05660909_00116 [Chitinophaga terrae (ex Kim and Jung 2007)]
MLGIFRTNIQTTKDKSDVIDAIVAQLPVTACSVDLEDCDKVLRIDSPVIFAPETIINLVADLGFDCQILD